LTQAAPRTLLSRQFFDTLSTRVRNGLEPYEGEYGTLADESCIPSYGIIELTERVQDQIIQTILGTPFLQ